MDKFISTIAALRRFEWGRALVKGHQSTSALYEEVRFLSIREIAELWFVEIGISASTIERELCLSLINMPRLKADHGLIKDYPAGALPPSDTVMTRDEIREFCEKQRWPLPKFWFDDTKIGPSYPGRPSVMHAIVQQLEQTAAAGQLKSKLAEQSRELEKWAVEMRFETKPPKAKAIENAIRKLYRELKKKATK